MELSEREQKMIGIGGIAILALVWIAFRRTGGPGTTSNGEAPSREKLNPAMQSMSGSGHLLGITPDGGFTRESKFLHFFDPDGGTLQPDCDYAHHVRHRYPTISGTNISTLIHHGYSPLMVPSKRDYDWFVNPPADQEFAG